MIELSDFRDGKQVLQSVPEPCFAHSFDVIVCGLGTAGSLAALFSAQNGLSVLGIETFTCVGGTHSAGGVQSNYFGCAGGRYEAVDQEIYDFAKRHTHTVAESRKLVVERKLLEHGIEIRYECTVCGVYLRNKQVIGVRVLSENGFEDLGARIVMDCTAEACVAALAGCETEFGRESDGQAQPYSLVSMIFDGKKYRYTNVDFGRVNPSDPKDLSRAVLFARSYQNDGYTGTEAITQMPLLGIREGRRILADKGVSIGDLFAGKETDTPMFYSYSDLDKHGWDIAFDSEELGDWAIGANLGAYNVTVAVPYRAILPKNYEGLLVPCRALGVDRDIASCVRMNFDMKKMAEVAAEWASLAIRRGTALREVPYEELKKRLLASGCLKDSDRRGVRVDGKRNWDGTPLVLRDVEWITEPEGLSEKLASEAPGEAIWSVRQMGEKALPILRKHLCSDNENARKHAAFALAMLGNTEGVEVLRETVRARDPLMLKDCRKNNNLRGCMAIYWLGRLADRGIAEELMALIEKEDELAREVYQIRHPQTTRYAVSDFHNVYFQFISQSVAALIRIGDVHVDLRKQIARSFETAFSDGTYYSRITKRPAESSEGNMTLAIRSIALSACRKWEL